MDNFFKKLNNIINNKKKMKMVNIQKVFIGPFIGHDKYDIISTGFKKVYNGKLRTRESVKETQIVSPVRQVLETQKIVEYYDYTLKDGADTFVAEFVAEPLNKVAQESVSISSLNLPFELKNPNNDIVDITEHHFARINSCIIDGIYVAYANNELFTYCKYDDDNFKIPDEVKENAIKYEFAIVSAAQMKQQKCIFVKADKEHSKENIKKYQPSVSYDLSADRGANVFLDEISLFTWSKSLRDTNVIPNKVLAYLSLCLSNTKTVKNKLRIKHIGEIKIQVNEKLIDRLSECYNEDFMNSLKLKDSIGLSDLYKKEKWDGMGIIRASKAKEILVKENPSMKNKDLYYFVGMACIQRLIPGAKGLLYVVHDDEFDNAINSNGEKVYADYDVILEDSNVKFICNEAYLDLDSYEIVRWSKTNKFSHTMSYGYWLALDNNKEELIQEVLDNVFDKMYKAVHDPAYCKAYLNMIGTNQIDDEIEIEDENLNTVFNKILNINPEAIRDPLVRNGLKYIFKNEIQKTKYGSIAIDGACRFIVSAPEAFFMTEKMTARCDNEGNIEKGLNNQELYDIIIDDIDDLFLTKPNEIFWDNDNSEAVMFRPPCYHAGQVPKVKLNNNIAEYTEINERKIYSKNLYDTKYWKGDTIVINAIGMILEAMGGADK